MPQPRGEEDELPIQLSRDVESLDAAATRGGGVENAGGGGGMAFLRTMRPNRQGPATTIVDGQDVTDRGTTPRSGRTATRNLTRGGATGLGRTAQAPAESAAAQAADALRDSIRGGLGRRRR